MKILYFGIYNPNYSRNRVLIGGLRKNGVEVLECNAPYYSWASYLKLLGKYFFLKKTFDAVIVGFPGQEAMLLIHLLTKKPIIFDVFTSHYGGYVLDRGKYSKDSLRAKWYKWLDKKSVELANVALLDTNAHIDFFVNEFSLPKNKFIRVFVGTDSDIFYPRSAEGYSGASLGGSKRNGGKFLVHFHGHYIPLQGVKHIIQAAKVLERENIEFNIIGKGQTYKNDRKLAEDLKIKNINFLDQVPYNKLADYINSADISLGIFGETKKASIVIPNKVYEAIACAKPVITADTPAIRELFTDGQDILLCKKADREDLAEKILLLKNNPDLREKIGLGGRQLFKKYLTEDNLGAQLKNIVYETIKLPKSL